MIFRFFTKATGKLNKTALTAFLLASASLSISACGFSNPMSGLSQGIAPKSNTANIAPSAAVAQSSPTPSIETTASIAAYRPTNPASNSWEVAHAAYSKKAEKYWDDVSAKRKQRNEKRRNGQAITQNDYVLNQPPVYDGPPKPAMPGQTTPVKPSARIPGTTDFLAAAKSVYGFTPDRPRNEEEFMRAYANAASQAGLTRYQLVALYAFETGGDGTHDLQAGMLKSNANARPISTAIGYNQLVATASVSVMHEFGPEIVRELKAQAQRAQGADRQRLLRKADVVSAMTTKARTVPHQWSAQAELAKTPAGLGIHAMTLDKDVGPLLQTHKLRTSMHFLHAKGVTRQLTGAELEMLNLTGDGNGYDMISMPQELREIVPTTNFFLRKGYERNPVAKRNNTVAKLLAATEEKMRINMQKEGAQAMHRAFQSSEMARN